MGNCSFATAAVKERHKLQKWRYDYIVNLIEHEAEVCPEKGECDDSTNCDHSDIDQMNYNFPFENLILEGGGCKGLAYCGAIKYLEEIDVMPSIKRFAGTSVGAIMVTLFAVGYTSEEIKVFIEQNLETLFKDGSYYNALGNLYRYFGYHPGERFEMWLGEKMEEKTGSADITFEEIRRMFGRELCVVVTNVNWMRTEYCHPKTTPNLPVRSAVIMSMSIPGYCAKTTVKTISPRRYRLILHMRYLLWNTVLDDKGVFTAKWYEMFGKSDVFADGSVLCNYPIHCFDGWFLSMAKEDNFIQRLLLPKGRHSAYADRFKEENINIKSLGLSVFAEADQDYLSEGLEHGNPKPRKPYKETRIYKEREEKAVALKKAENVHMRLGEAMVSFQKVIDEKSSDDDVITKAELESALNEEKLSKTDVEILFGEKATVEEVMELLDHNKDGKIDQMELVSFIGELGIPLHDRTISHQRRDIMGMKGFLLRLIDTLLTNQEMICCQYPDTKRTVGINTGYVSKTDFDLEEGDKDFILHVYTYRISIGKDPRMPETQDFLTCVKTPFRNIIVLPDHDAKIINKIVSSALGIDQNSQQLFYMSRCI